MRPLLVPVALALSMQLAPGASAQTGAAPPPALMQASLSVAPQQPALDREQPPPPKATALQPAPSATQPQEPQREPGTAMLLAGLALMAVS